MSIKVTCQELIDDPVQNVNHIVTLVRSFESDDRVRPGFPFWQAAIRKI